MQRRLLLALGLPIAALGICAATIPAHAAGSTNIAVRPQYAGTTTLSHGHFRFDLSPGASVDDAVQIQNLGQAPATIKIYAADTIQAQGGGLSPLYATDTMHAVGLWIKLKFSEVTLSPGQSTSDPFTLTIPAGTEPGDHIGAVVTQTGGGPGPNGVGFTVISRAALLVEANVPGQLSPSATITSLQAHADAVDDHKFTFAISLHNTGNVLLNVNGKLIISDDSGRQVGSLKFNPYGAYAIPGGTLDIRTSPWTFGTGTFHVQAHLNVLADDKPFTTLLSNTLTYTYIDWPLLIAIVLGAAILASGIGLMAYRAIQARRLQVRKRLPRRKLKRIPARRR